MGLFSYLGREFFYLKELLRVTREVGWIKPDSETLTPDHLESVVDEHRDLPVFITDTGEVTFAEYDAYANRVAHWALAQGLKPGDTVALFLTNRWEYIAIWYGLSKVGVVSALLNYQLRGASLAHCLDISGASVVLLEDELKEAYDSACDQISCEMDPWYLDRTPAPDGAGDFDEVLTGLPSDRPSRDHRAHLRARDACLKMYTSGTTGMPKAAPLAHTRVMYYLNIFSAGCNAGPGDRMFMVLPLYHSTGGLCGVGCAISRGGALIVRQKFSASLFWDEVQRFQATLFMYVGELCRFLVSTPPTPAEDDHRIRCIIGNGLRPDIWVKFQERFKIPRIMEFYGATEGNVGLVNLDSKPGAIGRIPPWLKWRFNVELAAYDYAAEAPLRGPDGFCRRTEPDEVGEAIGRIDPNDTRFRFEGYQNKEETEKKVLHNAFEEGDAWFRTGDLLKRDKEGYFYFIDRVGDTFRWRSENVSTNEVAEAIGRFPGVEQANVYGVEVPGYPGKAGMAALVTSPDIDLVGLRAHIHDALPPYARPVFLRLQHETDTTGTFKFRKVDLVKQGYDPAIVTDPLLFDDETGYTRLRPALFTAINDGTKRL
ncbi:MAG: long-chain-acyl-CoA synthetase [Maricaulis sp.]|jgi:fatty-acyl-CoA synthase|nr:long-chain-acyl-CoA synthetase [Maricaulis sp.]